MLFDLDCSGSHYFVSSLKLEEGKTLSECSPTIDLVCLDSKDNVNFCHVCEDFYQNSKESSYFPYHMRGLTINYLDGSIFMKNDRLTFNPFAQYKNSFILNGIFPGHEAIKILRNYQVKSYYENPDCKLISPTEVTIALQDATFKRITVAYVGSVNKDFIKDSGVITDSRSFSLGSPIIEQARAYGLWSYILQNHHEKMRKLCLNS